MTAKRLEHITPIGVEQMGDLADSLDDPDVLRLENLDTDWRPPTEALAMTRQSIDEDDANSYLPFLGANDLREAAAERVARQTGLDVDWRTGCVISAGGLSGIFNVLLAVLEPGDEVVLTDPTYVGLLNRVRLAGGVPRLVPLVPGPGGWRLDTDALDVIDATRVRAILMMSPSMPTGAVLDQDEWRAIGDFCRRADAWLIDDAAMERLLFDGRPVIHPASLPDLAGRVITVGSASKEYRMIGWRVGWIVGPPAVMADVARVSISNVVCQSGIAMPAVAAAVRSADDGIDAFSRELEARRDLLLDELRDYSPIPPHGGWSLLVDTSPLGIDAVEASRRLLDIAKIAATPMVNWGGRRCDNYLRLVFSNEPTERLTGIGARFDEAFANHKE